MARIIALCTLLAFAVSCDKSPTRIPEPHTNKSQVPSQPSTPKISAPKEVPESLKSQVERDWPEIEKEGEAFLEQFAAATRARAENDRAKMDVAVDAAKKHYEAALEKWNAIYYSVDDIDDEDLAEKCRRWLRKWNKQVDGWTRKAKGLKEFSRVK